MPAKIERPAGPRSYALPRAFAEILPAAGGAILAVPKSCRTSRVPGDCALSQVIFGLRQAGLQFGGSVAIQGAGGLGIQAAAVAKDMGVATVIVIDQLAGRLDLARQCGADHTINVKEITDKKDRVNMVRKLTGSNGVDVACDFVGFPPVVPEGIEMLRYGGTYLEIGCISRGPRWS